MLHCVHSDHWPKTGVVTGGRVGGCVGGFVGGCVGTVNVCMGVVVVLTGVERGIVVVVGG